MDACAGTGFVLAADLPLTDEEDEPDEEVELPEVIVFRFSCRWESGIC